MMVKRKEKKRDKKFGVGNSSNNDYNDENNRVFLINR